MSKICDFEVITNKDEIFEQEKNNVEYSNIRTDSSEEDVLYDEKLIVYPSNHVEIFTEIHKEIDAPRLYLRLYKTTMIWLSFLKREDNHEDLYLTLKHDTLKSQLDKYEFSTTEIWKNKTNNLFGGILYI
jgi:hypothetical protein